MPALIQSGVALLSVVIIFASSFLNVQTQQYEVLSHRETKSHIIFQCANTKTKTKSTVVNINKNNGKVKIDFKDKRQQIEFNIEYDNTISPQDREQVEQIMNNLKDYTKRNKSISGRVRHIIKDFVNKKL